MEENNKWVSWGTPLMFLIILFLSFGLMIPWLGHEFDEWHFVYYATRGAQQYGRTSLVLTCWAITLLRGIFIRYSGAGWQCCLFGYA